MPSKNGFVVETNERRQGGRNDTLCRWTMKLCKVKLTTFPPIKSFFEWCRIPQPKHDDDDDDDTGTCRCKASCHSSYLWLQSLLLCDKLYWFATWRKCLRVLTTCINNRTSTTVLIANKCIVVNVPAVVFLIFYPGYASILQRQAATLLRGLYYNRV